MRTVHSHPESMPMGSPLGGQAADRELRVLVVDDHPAVRLGLLQLLDDQPDRRGRCRRVRRGGEVAGRARADRRRGRRLPARLAQRPVAHPDVEGARPGAPCGDVFGVLRRPAGGGVRRRRRRRAREQGRRRRRVVPCGSRRRARADRGFRSSRLRSPARCGAGSGPRNRRSSACCWPGSTRPRSPPRSASPQRALDSRRWAMLHKLEGTAARLRPALRRAVPRCSAAGSGAGARPGAERPVVAASLTMSCDERQRHPVPDTSGAPAVRPAALPGGRPERAAAGRRRRGHDRGARRRTGCRRFASTRRAPR